MTTETTDLSAILNAVPKLVHLLEPLSDEARSRAIGAAMTLLGHPAEPRLGALLREQPTKSDGGISPKAAVWVQRNGLTRTQLDQVYSIDEHGVEAIASKLPGKSKRQQTVEAYLLCGIKAFLQTGESAFTDKEARQLCEKVGCYDVANHSNYMKAFDNLLSGSRESGWRLTNPGLSTGGEIIKKLSAHET